MSWTYESAYITGYTTGTTGLEILKPMTFYVSGLKYSGTGITVIQSSWFTGYGIIGSGDISTEVSGELVYYSDNQYWRVDVIVSDQNAPGELATGLFELYWNTGSTNASTGWEDTTGFIRMFGNADLDAWNILTGGPASVASSLHTHGEAAQNLSALDDTNIPETIADGSGLVWDAGNSKWITGSIAGVTDHGSLDGLGDLDHPQYVQTGVFDTWTGSEYETTSGNYVTTSGSYVATSGDYVATSGDYVTTSGVFVVVSGDYVTTSGSYVAASGDYVTTSGTIADYPTVSGTVSTINGDYVKTDASRGISGTMEFTGAIYVGDVAGGNYFKFYVDGSDLRIDAIGGATIVVSGNVSGVDGSKIYGAVLL